MMYAFDPLTNERITANHGLNAKCPICDGEVVAKCGTIKIWHWAHKNLEDCDTWSDGESPWHLSWKNLVKPQYCEVKIGEHRADICDTTQPIPRIIELQNSAISCEDIKIREEYYKNMIWIFNADSFAENFSFRKKEKDGHSFFTFRWKHPRQSLWYINKDLFLDMGANIFHIKKLYSNTPCGGWGYFLKRETFIKKYMGGIING